jgi:hypothetical protein
VKIGLNRIRHENENLENELERTSYNVEAQPPVCPSARLMAGTLIDTSSADQRARKLEAKISQNRSLIDQLRQERDALIADQAELQARYNKATEVCLPSYVPIRFDLTIILAANRGYPSAIREIAI